MLYGYRLSTLGVVDGITVEAGELETVWIEDSLRALIRND